MLFLLGSRLLVDLLVVTVLLALTFVSLANLFDLFLDDCRLFLFLLLFFDNVMIVYLAAGNSKREMATAVLGNWLLLPR